MSTNDRSTHFRQFAELLWRDLLNLNGGKLYAQDWHHPKEHERTLRRIAERAYDLACHARHFDGYGADGIEAVPDMTAWYEQEG